VQGRLQMYDVLTRLGQECSADMSGTAEIWPRDHSLAQRDIRPRFNNLGHVLRLGRVKFRKLIALVEDAQSQSLADFSV
jgi:hypothetical protein